MSEHEPFWKVLQDFRLDCAIERQEWQDECMRRSKAANKVGVGFLGQIKNKLTGKMNARARYWAERARKVRLLK